jgi:hypothetical protein
MINLIKKITICLLTICIIISINGCTNHLKRATQPIEGHNDLKKAKESVYKLEDPEDLARVALEAQENSLRLLAVQQISKQAVLVDLVTKSNDDWVQFAAAQKLSDPSILKKVTSEKDNCRIDLLHKMIVSFENITGAHRLRLMANIYPVLLVLSEPTVANEVGEILSIDLSWSPTYQRYSVASGILTMSGENFSCSITLENIDEPIYHNWSTVFLDSFATYQGVTELTFREAEIYSGSLFVSLFDYLPIDCQVEIAIQLLEQLPLYCGHFFVGYPDCSSDNFRSNMCGDITSLMASVGEPLVTKLIPYIDHEKIFVSEVAITALGRIGDQRALKPLLDAHKDVTPGLWTEKKVIERSLKMLGWEPD